MEAQPLAPGIELTTAETHALASDALAAVRALMDEAFGGEFTEDDWAHTLGGWHVLASDSGVLVAHASVVERPIAVGGRLFRTGDVEGVATAPARQGQGLGSLVMRRLERGLRARFELGVLSTGEHGFYERLGWERWQGPTFVREPAAVTRTSDEDDGIMVLRFGPSASIDLAQPISCDSRPGDDW